VEATNRFVDAPGAPLSRDVGVRLVGLYRHGSAEVLALSGDGFAFLQRTAARRWRELVGARRVVRAADSRWLVARRASTVRRRSASGGAAVMATSSDGHRDVTGAY
jgi:hypothetical protein